MNRRPPLDQQPTRDIGPYKLAHRIAVGGMAEVYRALWPQKAGGDRAVVIKRLLPALVDDVEQRQMFQHEAELGVRINHPNVVEVLDHGMDDGSPYLVLEYVFGVDLWRLVRWMAQSRLRFRVPTAVWIARELLAGLCAVHAVTDANGIPLGVMHRDVSPSNLFLSVHGEVKLGDMGIARAALRDNARHPSAGARTKGKVGYLPPEEVTGGAVDQRGDVFSAAVVLAEMLIGRPLFAGGTPIGVLLAIRDGDLGRLHAEIPNFPPGLGTVVLDALARDPDVRTASAEAFAASLERFVAEPAEQLKAELGELVVGALDDDGSSSDRTSLAQTVEARLDDVDGPSSPPPPREPTPLPPGVAGYDDTPSVPARHDSKPAYTVHRPNQEPTVFTFASLVKALTTNELRPSDRVELDGGATSPIAMVPELARHLPASARTPTVRKRIRLAETGELFDLSESSMVNVLVETLASKDDGLLLCENGALRKEIYVKEGVPCFVTSNSPSELLGESLVANGVIAREELNMALAMMPRFEGRLGESLVALGLVDPVMLVRSIGHQVRDKLLELFTWTEGHVALYRGVDPPERAFPIDLEPWELIEQGVQRRIEHGLADPRLTAEAPNAVLVRTPMSLANIALPDHLEEICMACAGPRTISELDSYSREPGRARLGAAALIALGALTWRS